MKPGYKQTEVGVIPEEWEVSFIDKLCSEVFDCNHSTPVWTSTGSVVIRNQNIRDGKLDLSQPSYTDEIHFAERTRRAVPTFGDLVITREAPMGLVCMIPNGLKCCLGQRMVLLRPNHNTIETVYFLFALLSEFVQRSILVAGGTGSTVSNLRIPILKKLPIPLPPLPEQQAIAAALSDVDALLGGLERLITKKRDLKQAAMQQLLTGQTRLPGFDGAWEVKTIGEFTECTAGGTPSTIIQSYWGGSIRWMNSGELNLKKVEEVEGRITEEGLHNSSTKLIPIRCVLIGLAGQGKTRGTVAMNYVEVCTNQSIAAIFPNITFVPEYLYFNLDSRYDELRELSAGDGGRGGLNLTIIKSLPIPFPPLPEQIAIAAVLSDMDAELVALEQRRTKTRALKQAMMQELLTGRTRLIARGDAENAE